MLEEVLLLSQVSVQYETNTINVQWQNQVKKKGAVIAAVPHRASYSAKDKARFLAEVPGAEAYIAIMGW